MIGVNGHTLDVREGLKNMQQTVQGASKKRGILKSALFLGLLWPNPIFLWYVQYPLGYNTFLDDNRIYKTSLINIFYKFSNLTSRIIMINYHS